MIPILKIILCSSLLITLYYFFLEKEKMYHFNRFFLIFSLIFSYTAPFISVETNLTEPLNSSNRLIEGTQQILHLTPKQGSISWEAIIWLVYGFITLILVVRFIISISKIRSIKGKKINYQNYKIILTKENISPFSFWDTIYLKESYFANNTIDTRIFLHEKSHLDQKHSWDLLLIEFLKIFTWFNPAIYFYKKAILTNHEFLADETILKYNFNIRDYQNLILQEIILAQKYGLSHQFNFNNTKKRFIMMNTKKSNLVGYKKIISIPVLIIVCTLFIQKIYADNSNLKSKTQSLEKNKADLTKKISDTIYPKISEISKTNEETRKTVSDVSTLPSESADKSAIAPEYPGGMDQLRSKVASLFDSANMRPAKGQGTYKCQLLYTINENGNVTDIRTEGNDETFNNLVKTAFMKATGDVIWKPATINGKAVRYQMKLPMMMSFK